VRGQISLYPNVVSPDTTKEYNMVGQGGKVGQMSQWGATRVGDLPGEDQGQGVSTMQVLGYAPWLVKAVMLWITFGLNCIQIAGTSTVGGLG
jgi:hypothetical protein